jgi:hypothetical protein
MAHSDRQKTNSAAKSRSDEASRLLRPTDAKPNSWATKWRSIGSEVPARRRSEAQDVDPRPAVGESLAVALELLGERQEVVGGEDRLGRAACACSGQDDAALALARLDQRLLGIDEEPVEVVDGVAGPEPEVGDDLVVAAAGGVELAAGVAELGDQGRLDVGVDVFWPNENGISPRSMVAAISSRAWMIESASSAEIRPTLASILAWAREAATSWR